MLFGILGSKNSDVVALSGIGPVTDFLINDNILTQLRPIHNQRRSATLRRDDTPKDPPRIRFKFIQNNKFQR